MYVVRREYGRGQLYLIGWDEVYGTVCGGFSKALTFVTKAEAETAAAQANRTCCGYQGAPKPEGMIFRVVVASF